MQPVDSADSSRFEDAAGVVVRVRAAGSVSSGGAGDAGFDARSAAIVMSVVRAVASAGHTVMVTIHQPSINIFESSDTLLLLQVCWACSRAHSSSAALPQPSHLSRFIVQTRQQRLF